MVIETGYELGMVDMNRSLVELVRAGEITVENAYAYSNQQEPRATAMTNHLFTYEF